MNVVSSNPSATPATISFNIGTGLSTGDALSAAISAFNDQTSTTGVTAQLNTAGTGITLENASGDDISLTSAATSAGSFNAGGLTTAPSASAYVTGALTMDSANSFGIQTTAGTLGGGTSFFTSTGSSSQLQPASSIDVSTAASATRTLSTVDSCISVISAQRAKFGALESRFNDTISNLQTSSDNLSTARSRIQDTDFAAETANLSRTQILQQAGTAMVAQANQLPQQVLQLLKSG